VSIFVSELSGGGVPDATASLGVCSGCVFGLCVENNFSVLVVHL